MFNGVPTPENTYLISCQDAERVSSEVAKDGSQTLGVGLFIGKVEYQTWGAESAVAEQAICLVMKYKGPEHMKKRITLGWMRPSSISITYKTVAVDEFVEETKRHHHHTGPHHHSGPHPKKKEFTRDIQPSPVESARMTLLVLCIQLTYPGAKARNVMNWVAMVFHGHAKVHHGNQSFNVPYTVSYGDIVKAGVESKGKSAIVPGAGSTASIAYGRIHVLSEAGGFVEIDRMGNPVGYLLGPATLEGRGHGVNWQPGKTGLLLLPTQSMDGKTEYTEPKNFGTRRCDEHCRNVCL